MAAEHDIPAEPPDGTALYWPESDTEWATVLIRDDRVPAANADNLIPAQRWLLPNAAAEADPMTWPEALEWVAGAGCTVGNETRLTVAERTDGPS